MLQIADKPKLCSVSTLGEKIAKIVFDCASAKVTDMIFFREDFRFKCRRCAVFCCKLGGPKVSEKDLKRLEAAGYSAEDVLDTTVADRTTQLTTREKLLKQKPDGSCIFLRYNSQDKAYECAIYDLRPAVCRLYPFEYERTEPNAIVLGFIPCCNGLDSRDGALVDRKFVEERLLEAVLDLL